MAKDKIDLPALVRETRELRGENQTQFGAAIGVSRRTVSRWENDRRARFDEPAVARIIVALREIDEAAATKLADAYGLPLPAAHREVPTQALDRALLAACDALDIGPRRARAGIAVFLAAARAAGASLEMAHAYVVAK